LYRRYYQGYNSDDQAAQRPFYQNNETDGQDNDIQQAEENNNAISGVQEPEIIIPEKPEQNTEMHRKPFPSLPSLNASPGIANNSSRIAKFFRSFNKDDLILLALILIFLIDGVEDNLLLLILVFLFFAGLDT